MQDDGSTGRCRCVVDAINASLFSWFSRTDYACVVGQNNVKIMYAIVIIIVSRALSVFLLLVPGDVGE